MKNETSQSAETAFSFLCKRNPFEISQSEYVQRLIFFQDKKGDEAIEALAGFYIWSIDNLKNEGCTHAIVSTFAHDLGEADDPLSLPRSSSYLKFWKLELKKHSH